MSNRRRGALAVVMGSVLVLVAGVAPPSSAASATASPPAARARVAGERVEWSGAIEPLAPSRILDTRTGTGAARAPVGRNGVVELQVGGRGGVPSVGAGAVALTVTAANSTASGYLTVWPTGAPRPVASSLNLIAGRTVANTVVAKVGVDGKVSIYNSTPATDVIVDVTGWFPEGGSVEPLVPSRILDTRVHAWQWLEQGETRTLRVSGAGGVPDAGVSAVVLNVTAADPSKEGYLTVWPTGAKRPATSNVNFAARQTVPNAVIAKVGTDGSISIFNSAGNTQVIVDVLGWFPDTGGIEPLVPARLLDTRSGVGAPPARVGARSSIDVTVTGRGGVPPVGVSAVVLNVTSTASTAESYLTVWPTGSPRPTASSLNFLRGQNVPNLVVAKVGVGGRVSVFNNAGATHVLADVVGWFPDGSAAPSTVLQPWADTVVVGGGDVLERTGDSMTGGTVTLASSADVPRAGDPLLAMPGRVAGEGIVGVVASVADAPRGTTVVTYHPTDIGTALADFEEAYDGPLTGAAAVGSVSTGPGTGAMRSGAGLAAGAAGSGGGWDFSPFAGIECTGAAGTQITALDFDMAGPGASWDVDLSERRVRFVLTATPTLTATMAASGGFSCTYSQSVGNWPIGSLWVEPSLELSVTGTFDGDLTSTASAPITLGFEAAGGGRNLSSANLAGSAEFHTDELGGSVGLDVAVSLAARLFGRVGVEGSFGMALDGQLDPGRQPCVTVVIAPTVEFGVTVDMWLADWSFTVADFQGEPVSLYSANPSPPCTEDDTPVWTGSVTVQNHEALVSGHHDVELTIRPQPRPKGLPGYDGYQSAYVTASANGDSDGCGGAYSGSGGYESPYEITYPWAPEVTVTSPGGFFRLSLTPDPDGSSPDHVEVDGIFTRDNQVIGTVTDCEGGSSPTVVEPQAAFWVVQDLCVAALVEGIRSEVASTGERRTLAGTATRDLTYAPPFAEGTASCTVTWQLTSLPDPDGDGVPG